jgi:hypothetical protein
LDERAAYPKKKKEFKSTMRKPQPSDNVFSDTKNKNIQSILQIMYLCS